MEARRGVLERKGKKEGEKLTDKGKGLKEKGKKEKKKKRRKKEKVADDH